jgi:hypothetical protein
MSVVHCVPPPPFGEILLQAKAEVAFDRLVTVWSKASFSRVLGRNPWSFAVICWRLGFVFANSQLLVANCCFPIPRDHGDHVRSRRSVLPVYTRGWSWVDVGRTSHPPYTPPKSKGLTRFLPGDPNPMYFRMISFCPLGQCSRSLLWLVAEC